MKAKYYIGLLAGIIAGTFYLQANELPGYTERAVPGNQMVTTVYHSDYDFHYASRIKRFHSSYTAFGFYSPVYTDAFWYTYQPMTWGVSIYAGGGFGIGYSWGYPYYGGGYYSYWDYSPGMYYWNYSPGWSYWYSPVYYSVRVKYRNYNHYYNIFYQFDKSIWTN